MGFSFPVLCCNYLSHVMMVMVGVLLMQGMVRTMCMLLLTACMMMAVMVMAVLGMGVLVAMMTLAMMHVMRC